VIARLSRGTRRVLREELQLRLPEQWNFTHYLGVLALFFFLLQVGTGVLLMAYYRPVPADAYASIWWVVNEAHLGAQVRQLHARGADLLLALIAAHFAVVLWRLSYRKPRRATWMLGVVMLVVALAFGFTGVLLPWNQSGYWLADGAKNAISGVPVIGSFILKLLWGGTDITDDTLLRFYVFHVGLLPWAMVLLITVHLGLVWRRGLSGNETGGQSARGLPVVPDFVLNVLLSVLISLGVALTIAVLAGVPMGRRADPLAPIKLIDLPWYFAGVKKIFAWLPGRGGIVIVTAVVVLLFLVPFLDRSQQGSNLRGWMVRVAGLGLVVAFVLAGVLSLVR